MKRILFVYTLLAVTLAAVILAVPTLVQAQSLVSLFDIDTGVRPLGMGGAFTGLSDDEHALFYNPAALASFADIAVNSLYKSHFGITDYGNISFAKKNLGAGMLFFNSRGVPRRDEQGKEIGTLNYSNLAFIASYGVSLAELPLPEAPPILNRLAIGAQAKFYRVKTIKAGSGSTLAIGPALMLDLGRLSFGGLTVDDLRLGMLIENLLSRSIEYGSGHVEPWEMGLRLGASATIKNLIVAADLESEGVLHLGVEYQVEVEPLGGQGLALRGGAFVGQRSSLTLGLGFKVKMGKVNNFHVDYAFIAHPQLPGSHSLSISAAFDP